MNAEIISVGTELLMGSTFNTNAYYLSKRLYEIGINVLFHTTVGDDSGSLKKTIEIAINRADLLIFTGGLGPTADDMTKEVVSNVLDLGLELNKNIENSIRKYFSDSNRPMSSNNIKQAYLPKGAKYLNNEIGTAPGVYIEWSNRKLVLLPGPPEEMNLMFNKYVVPLIKQDYIIRTKTINTIGIGESALESLLVDIINKQSNPSVATYAKQGRVDIKIIAKGYMEDQVNLLLKNKVTEITGLVGDYIYSYNSESIVEVVFNLLKEKNMKIAFCESCTGGLVSAKLTEIPGASQVFEKGIIAYSNSVKVENLGVKESTLKEYGAVSEEVAMEMAKGLLLKSRVDIVLSITGIAGPGGGDVLKPVGLVYIGIATKDKAYVVKSLFNGDRRVIQNSSALRAYDELRKFLQ